MMSIPMFSQVIQPTDSVDHCVNITVDEWHEMTIEQMWNADTTFAVHGAKMGIVDIYRFRKVHERLVIYTRAYFQWKNGIPSWYWFAPTPCKNKEYLDQILLLD